MPADDNDHSARFSRQQMSEIAFSAAIGAAMMLFCGWGLSWFRPVEESIYSRSILGFMWLLRIGGVMMIVAAVGLWTGIRLMLIYDAGIAMLIGVLMVPTGGLWLVNSNWQGLLLVVFGALFVRSGLGSWLAYRGSNAGYAFPVASGQDDSSVPPPVATADPAARQEAMDRLLARKKREASPEPAPAVVKPAPELPRPPAKVPPLAKNEPPPEGFLAELGREDSKRK